MCYISDLAKLRAHYPGWGITKDLRTTFQEIHDAWVARSRA
jgi:CDP-paratose 2-epimerase